MPCPWTSSATSYWTGCCPAAATTTSPCSSSAVTRRARCRPRPDRICSSGACPLAPIRDQSGTAQRLGSDAALAGFHVVAVWTAHAEGPFSRCGPPYGSVGLGPGTSEFFEADRAACAADQLDRHLLDRFSVHPCGRRPAHRGRRAAFRALRDGEPLAHDFPLLPRGRTASSLRNDRGQEWSPSRVRGLVEPGSSAAAGPG